MSNHITTITVVDGNGRTKTITTSYTPDEFRDAIEVTLPFVGGKLQAMAKILDEVFTITTDEQ